MIMGIFIDSSGEGSIPNHAVKPGWSLELDEEDDGGSRNSHLGTESLWIELCSMVTKRKKKRGKIKDTWAN
jgi:hypothetical protein